jgi:hypothetical protein
MSRLKKEILSKLKEYAGKMGKDHLGGDDSPSPKRGGLRDFDGYDNVDYNQDMPMDEDSPESAHPQGSKKLTNRTTVMDMLDVISHKEFGPDYHKLSTKQKKEVHKLAIKGKLIKQSPFKESVNERNTSVNKRRAGAELKQKLKGKRSDGMGKYTATIYGLDSKGKRVELKSLNDLNKYSKFELDESINEGKKKLPKFKNIPSWARYVAQHSDGEWTWYEETPTMIKFRDGSGGAWKQDGNQTYTGVKTDGKDWDKMPTYYNVKNGKITESINEVKEPEVITQLRKIVKDKQNSLVVDTKSKKKVRVDMQSANLMVQVYDALKQQSNKDKFVKSGIVMMGHTAYKLIKNESVNEAKAFVVMFKDKKDLPNRNVKPSSAAYSKEVDAKKFLKSVENDGGKGMIVKSNVSGMKVEAKDVEVYHKSYTHAIEAAEAYALKKGYTIEDDEMFTKVGMNSKRPSVGKTTKVNLELLRKGKPQKKMLHIQVYGMKNGYELNAYIN